MGDSLVTLTGNDVIHEKAVSDGAVVNVEFRFRSFEADVVGVELHQLHGLVVRPGRHQVAPRAPSQAVDRAFVMLCPLKKSCLHLTTMFRAKKTSTLFSIRKAV